MQPPIGPLTGYKFEDRTHSLTIFYKTDDEFTNCWNM